MANRPLGGKVVLVTGGARRLGRHIALTLAAAGADVSITYHKSKTEAAETADAIVALGAGALAIECDVRAEEQVRAAVTAVANSFGRLDILVNNAAVFATGPLESLSLESWDDVFATNTRGPFLAAREALPHLRAAEGRIVNIGSVGGLRAWATHAHYCASKAALHSLTQAMAKAFAPGVSVNCVAPGWIEMPQRIEAKDALEDSTQSAVHFAARTPMKRNGSAEDVAQAVLFFAAGPHFITGQILVVDGGLSLL